MLPLVQLPSRASSLDSWWDSTAHRRCRRPSLREMRQRSTDRTRAIATRDPPFTASPARSVAASGGGRRRGVIPSVRSAGVGRQMIWWVRRTGGLLVDLDLRQGMRED